MGSVKICVLGGHVGDERTSKSERRTRGRTRGLQGRGQALKERGLNEQASKVQGWRGEAGVME